MPRFIVTANRLNRRTVIPAKLPDKNNIFDIVTKGFQFDAVEVADADMPPTMDDKWYKDQRGLFYWGGGINELRSTVTSPPASVPVPAPTPTTAPSKPSFQWFKDLEIEKIWNQFNERGENVTVAVLDTGYDTANPELPVPVMTKLFVNNPTNTATIHDKVGHGTFCTSLIGARNKNTNIGIAPLCKILVGKISLLGELSDIAVILEGIAWAIQSGAEIISISIGVPLTDQQQIDQLQTRLNDIVRDKNILIFAACGDSESGQVISKEFYPASLDNCISVGTVKNNVLDNLTVRSNKTNIHTLGVDIEAFTVNGTIEKQSGTSMSVPIAAGLMGLAISLTKKRNNGQWDKNQLLQKMIQTGNPIAGFTEKRIINSVKFFQSL